MVADAKAAAEVISKAGLKKTKDPRGRKPKGTASKRDIAAALGVTDTTLVNAEHQTETAEEFPFMQGWRQSEGRARPLVRTARSNSTAGTSASCCHFEDWSRVMLRSARVAGPRGVHQKLEGSKSSRSTLNSGRHLAPDAALLHLLQQRAGLALRTNADLAALPPISRDLLALGIPADCGESVPGLPVCLI